MNGWITTGETAKRLGLDPHAVYRLIESGNLPAVAVGRVYFVCAAEVEVLRAEAAPGVGHEIPSFAV